MDWENIAPMVIGFGLVVVLPIVALLLNHQRRMAEFLHGQGARHNQATDVRLEQLTNEIAELRTIVHQLMINSDGPPVLSNQSQVSAPPPAPQQTLQR